MSPLFDGGVRRRSRLAVLVVVPAGAAGMALLGAIFNLGSIIRCVTARFSRHHRHHRCLDPAGQFGAGIYGPQPQVLEGWFETRASSSDRFISTASIC